MAAIEIVFSGLMMFAKPDGNGHIMVTAVTGKQNEVHAAWMVRGGEKVAFKGEIQLVGASGRVDDGATGYKKYVPSVTEALDGAGLTKPKPSPCISSPAGSGCIYRNGYIKLMGGKLDAWLGKDTRDFRFKVGSKGDHHSQMAHEVKWTGTASKIVVGGKEWTLADGDRIEITNHPQTNSGRHFGVLRHLWGASDNDTDANWPLPVSGDDLRKALEGLLGRHVKGQLLSNEDLLSAILEEIMIPSRPLFCPPARQ